MLKSSAVLSAALAALMVTPAIAAADTYVSPIVSVVFGGDTDDSKVGFGGTVTFMGNGMGLEVEVAHTPDFFEGLNVTTYSVGYVAGGDAGAGGIKPFGVAGVTLMRASVDGFDAENKFAINLGAGIVALFNETVGIRAEIRYFRRVEDDEAGLVPLEDEIFDYFRAGFGVVFRF